MHELPAIVGVSLTAVSTAYALLACAVMWRRRTGRGRPARGTASAPVPTSGPLPPVSVLKALCGAEPGLYAQLRSFCAQRYPGLQVVFGVRESTDPALQVVRRLQGEFPGLDTAVVIDPRLHGCNNKISNLLNMLPSARHACLVMADSDITVPPDYLAHVVPPLSDPDVGLVTCAYFGRPAVHPTARASSPLSSPLSSRLGAMFINEWFMPSVLLAAAFGSRSFVSGATIAMRREVLAGVGGLERLSNLLADDYKLGELVRRQGLTVQLSDMAVETSVNESDLGALCRHELRWLRTIQSAQPLGYACCFPSFPLPTALAGAALAGLHTAALWLLGITALARLVLHYFVASGSAWQRSRQLLLVPLRDALLAALWAWSFCRRRIVWREQRYGIGEDGSLHRVG